MAVDGIIPEDWNSRLVTIYISSTIRLASSKLSRGLVDTTATQCRGPGFVREVEVSTEKWRAEKPQTSLQSLLARFTCHTTLYLARAVTIDFQVVPGNV